MPPSPVMENAAVPPSEQKSPRAQLLFGLIAGVCLLLVGFALYWFASRVEGPPPEPLTIGIVRYLKIYDPEIDGFIEQMHELGYREDEHVVYRIFRVDTVEETGPAVQQLVAEDVDLIYAITTVAAAAALRETKAAGRTDIPVVFAQGNAPVQSGIIGSFRSSGNNATGVAVNFVETTSKKLEYLKTIAPDAKRVGYFDSVHTDPAAQFTLEELKNQAPDFGLTLVRYELKNPVGSSSIAEIEDVLAGIQPGEIDVYFHLPGPLMGAQAQPTIVEGVNRLGLPSIWLETPSVQIGGFFAYSHDLYLLGSQAADIANKVLLGARPTDIPIEFPLKYILAVNLATANEIGIELPQSLVFLADVIVE